MFNNIVTWRGGADMRGLHVCESETSDIAAY